MKTISAPTCWAHIWIAGNLARIEDLCRSFAWHFPTCVAVTPTAYCYTGSTQRGACVRILNYPRYPRAVGGELVSIFQEADKLARHLLYSLDEKSCTVELPDKTYYLERAVLARETTRAELVEGAQRAGIRVVDGLGETIRSHPLEPDPPGYEAFEDNLGKKPMPNCS